MEFLDADAAAGRIPDGAVLTLSGNGSMLAPDELLQALERRFLRSGAPRGLTVYYPVVVGTRRGTGVDRFAHDGMVRCVVASCFDIWGIDVLAGMVRDGSIEAHCLPMGVMFQLLHAAADGQPGVLTPIGLHTFVDPAVRGTGQNERSAPSLAQRVDLGGRTYLFFKAPPIDAALIRGSVADEDGNVSFYREPIRQAPLAMALAARAGGGPVFAQVQAVVRRGSIPAARVDVPGCLIDGVVVAPAQRQTVLSEYDPALTGEWALAEPRTALPLQPDKVVARRAALELMPRSVVNLGFGLATLVAEVAVEEGVADLVTLSVEHGPLGGMPTGTATFGAAVSPTCILRGTDTFAMYHTGQLDLAILSAAEVDAEGNANVSRFGDAMPGPGGYIDISAGTRRLVLLTALTAGGTRVELNGPGLRVRQEGAVHRLVPQVRERTFSAEAALERAAEVTYVTDRCTFALLPEGLTLTEVAPGIDVRADVLDRLPFRPRVAERLGTWPAELFAEGRMGLRERWARKRRGAAPAVRAAGGRGDACPQCGARADSVERQPHHGGVLAVAEEAPAPSDVAPS